MKKARAIKIKTLRLYEYLCQPLSRCLSFKAQSSRRIAAAIYLGTLKLSHPEPRGVVEIRASGDWCASPESIFKCSRSPFIFSPLHRCCIYVCMHAWMNTHPHIMLSIYLPIFLCWKHLKRGWNYSHLYLWHHFSVFTLFHITYLLYLALFTRGSPFSLSSIHVLLFPSSVSKVLALEIYALPPSCYWLHAQESLCVCVTNREKERQDAVTNIPLLIM